MRTGSVEQSLADLFLAAVSLRPLENSVHLGGVVIPKNGEDFVELLERRQQWRDIVSFYMAAVDHHVGFAYHLEDGGLSLSGVEIILQSGGHAFDGFAGKRGIGGACRELAGGQSQLKVAQFVDVAGHLLQAVEGEIELVTVGN